MSTTQLSRRTFIRTSVAAGGGLILGFHIPTALAAKIEPKPWMAPTNGVEINAWLTIDADGTVTIRVPHTEMGQGGLTSVAMMIAEELDVEWSKVQTVFADANRHLRNDEEYISMITNGSRLVRQYHPHIMQAGASARERLKEAASRAWGVARFAIEAKQGVLRIGNLTATYAEFASDAAKITLETEPEIKKNADEWWLLGKPTQRLDIPVKVNGSAQYAIDTRIPGMVYASVKSSPVPWGALKGYDFEAIRNRPGVIAAVELKALPGRRGQPDMRNGVAVVADTWYRAKTALDLMPIEWESGENGNVSSASLLAEGRRLMDQQGIVTKEDPTALDLIAASEKVVAADYERPFETHARMEPINATVHVQADRVDVWTPAQDPSRAIALVADQLGINTADVYTHTMFLGGGFGGNGAGGTSVTRQATEISKQIGRPVKVLWTREEDIAHDNQRPMTVARFRAALGSDGLPEALFTRAMWFTQDGIERVGGSTADSPITRMSYSIPNRHHEAHNGKTHIPSATHRAPHINQLGFMTESFVDEMAIAGGWDPLEWRIAMTRDRDDWQRVLATLKEKSGFRTDLPRGEGMGVAITESGGTIVGACATVSVDRSGQLAVQKVVMVIDCGHLINPRTGAEQAEGSVCWELSHVLHGGLEMQDGRFTNTNFDTYNLMRIDEMPEVEVHWELSGGTKWGGLGEPAVPPVPPAVANAIYYATGKRLRSTPFKNHDLSWS